MYVCGNRSTYIHMHALAGRGFVVLANVEIVPSHPVWAEG